MKHDSFAYVVWNKFRQLLKNNCVYFLTINNNLSEFLLGSKYGQ